MLVYLLEAETPLSLFCKKELAVSMLAAWSSFIQASVIRYCCLPFAYFCPGLANSLSHKFTVAATRTDRVIWYCATVPDKFLPGPRRCLIRDLWPSKAEMQRDPESMVSKGLQSLQAGAFALNAPQFLVSPPNPFLLQPRMRT